MRLPPRAGEAGVTLLELLLTLAIMGILALVAVPVMDLSHRRAKEMETRQTLRELRKAIDRYKEAYDRGELGPKMIEASGYPRRLEELLSIETGSAPRRFLRRIPPDPLTGTTAWGVRSSTDPPRAAFSDGRDVWDVFTKAEGVALDGTRYETW